CHYLLPAGGRQRDLECPVLNMLHYLCPGTVGCPTRVYPRVESVHCRFNERPECAWSECVLKGASGSSNTGWLYWKKVGNAPLVGMNNSSRTPSPERAERTRAWRQTANEAEHRRPRRSSARLSTGKARLLELQSAGIPAIPRE